MKGDSKLVIKFKVGTKDSEAGFSFGARQKPNMAKKEKSPKN